MLEWLQGIRDRKRARCERGGSDPNVSYYGNLVTHHRHAVTDIVIYIGQMFALAAFIVAIYSAVYVGAAMLGPIK